MSEPLHQIENTVFAGCELKSADRVMIFVHGRGDTSDKMGNLAKQVVADEKMALIFPKATNNTWYPKGFMAPTADNEPWLTSALDLMKEILDHIRSYGIADHDIYFLGFSQGACLALDFATRHATRFGGVMALSGGLIGPEIYASNYEGDFEQTPVLMGCSDVDFHIPLDRLKESAAFVEQRGANVDLRIYEGMDHIINEDEIEAVKKLIKSN